MRSDELCSVIIPAYNCERFLKQSVQTALNQSYANLEIIVIDDCSTDTTWLKMQELQRDNNNIVIYQNPHNMGVSYTRNRGFQLARGKYVALLDSDDLWLPNKLSLQIRQLESTHSHICCSSYEMIDENGNSINRTFTVPRNLSFQQMLKQNFIGCSTAIFHQDVKDKIQMRPKFQHEDYVFWLEAMQAGFKVTAVDKVLVQYRVLNSSRSANKFKAAQSRWQIYRSFLNYSITRSVYYFCWYAMYSIKKRT